MLEKLKSIRLRYEDISHQISQPEVIGNQKLYIKLSKEYKEIEPLVLACNHYELLLQDIEESKDLMANETEDLEIIEMAQLQLDESNKKLEQLKERVKLLLIPKDPEDQKNVVVEIRAGAGGDEAGIFAGDLYRMYIKYCELKRWKVELVDFSESTSGGFKEVIFNVYGQNVYADLKFEGGVHRVQRVPQTETQGRVHTSAASVVVMPEADDFDVEIDMKDVRKDLFCSSGPGGQSVNTTYSAVRLTHVPTGIVAQCQDEKSQHKNFEKAFKVLRTRLYELELSKQLLEDSQKRKSMVSTGDRSAKIRTYNYPQSRVTEHRIGLTLYDLDNIINGDIQKIIDELKLAENIEKMKVVS